MSLCLTEDELVELTGKRKCGAQVKALRTMGIDHKVRGDGSPVVLRAHVERLFGGMASATVAKEYAFGNIKRATPAQT